MIREWFVRIGTVLLLAAVLLAGLLQFHNYSPNSFAAAPTSSPPAAQPNDGQLFDPAIIRAGDIAAGMSAKSVRVGTHSTSSVTVLFQGDKEISGRFEVLDTETEAYNPGDVIFTVDEKSAKSLPKVKMFHEVPSRFALHFSNAADKAKFGIVGSTGTGIIRITDYTAVYADVLEGVSDKATFAELKTLHVIPPRSPEENNPDFDKGIKAFSKFTLSPTQAVANPKAVYGWIENVHKTFQGMQFNGKRISASQRNKIKQWLSGAFTADRTEQLLRTHVPEVEGGYLIVGASSGLIPPLIINEVRNPKLTAGKNGQYIFTVTWILSGTQDARLTCYMQYSNSGWKIERYEYEMI